MLALGSKKDKQFWGKFWCYLSPTPGVSVHGEYWLMSLEISKGISEHIPTPSVCKAMRYLTFRFFEFQWAGRCVCSLIPLDWDVRSFGEGKGESAPQLLSCTRAKKVRNVGGN